MALSAKALEKLTRFRESANPGDLHPLDQERWCEFVIQAHLDGVEIQDTDVSEVLREKWTAEVSIRLGGRYDQERRLLARYDKLRRA